LNSNLTPSITVTYCNHFTAEQHPLAHLFYFNPIKKKIVPACILGVQLFTCFFLGSCKTIHMKVAIKQNSLFAEPNLPQLIFIILISSLTMSAFTVL